MSQQRLVHKLKAYSYLYDRSFGPLSYIASSTKIVESIKVGCYRMVCVYNILYVLSVSSDVSQNTVSQPSYCRLLPAFRLL